MRHLHDKLIELARRGSGRKTDPPAHSSDEGAQKKAKERGKERVVLRSRRDVGLMRVGGCKGGSIQLCNRRRSGGNKRNCEILRASRSDLNQWGFGPF